VVPLLVLLAAGMAVGEPEPAKKPSPTPAEQYQALEKEYNQAQEEFSRAYQDAKTKEERSKAFEEKYPKPEKFVPRFLELAQKNPTDPVAFDALLWVVSNGRGGVVTKGRDGLALNEALDKALAQLGRDHLNNPKLAQAIPNLTYSQDEGSKKFLRLVYEKSPDETARGQAGLTLARRLKQEAHGARMFQASPEKAKQAEQWYGKEQTQAMLALDPAKVEKEAEGLLEDVLAKYKDVKGDFRGTLGKAAEGELFELRNLAIGKVAPDIEGEDLNGKKFKLSEYRGKVVVLDFWGNW
jgi:hypothetical protein